MEIRDLSINEIFREDGKESYFMKLHRNPEQFTFKRNMAIGDDPKGQSSEDEEINFKSSDIQL